MSYLRTTIAALAALAARGGAHNSAVWAAHVDALLTVARHAPPYAWDAQACADLLEVLAAEPEPASLALRLAELPLALLALAEEGLAAADPPAAALRRIARALGHLRAEKGRAQELLEELQGDEHDDEVRALARIASYRLTPPEAVLATSRQFMAHPVRVWVAPLAWKLAAHDPAAAFGWLAGCTAQLIPLVRAERAAALLRYVGCLEAMRPLRRPTTVGRPARARDIGRLAARHLAFDREALLGDPALPRLNAGAGMGVAMLVDEGEPRERAAERLGLVQAGFWQCMEGLL